MNNSPAVAFRERVFSQNTCRSTTPIEFLAAGKHWEMFCANELTTFTSETPWADLGKKYILLFQFYANSGIPCVTLPLDFCSTDFSEEFIAELLEITNFRDLLYIYLDARRSESFTDVDLDEKEISNIRVSICPSDNIPVVVKIQSTAFEIRTLVQRADDGTDSLTLCFPLSLPSGIAESVNKILSGKCESKNWELVPPYPSVLSATNL